MRDELLFRPAPADVQRSGHSVHQQYKHFAAFAMKAAGVCPLPRHQLRLVLTHSTHLSMKVILIVTVLIIAITTEYKYIYLLLNFHISSTNTFMIFIVKQFSHTCFKHERFRVRFIFKVEHFAYGSYFKVSAKQFRVRTVPNT